MNLLGKGTISAALFAATASVICVAPAQALELANGSGFQFGDLTVEVDDDLTGTDTNATFKFLSSGDQFFSIPGFDDGNGVLSFFGPLKVAGGALSSSINPFITGIDTVSEGEVDFVLTGIANYFEHISGGTKSYDFDLIGYFTKAGDPGTVLGRGLADSRLLIGNDGLGRFEGALAVDVPTPAAVLPVLGGLLGMASKRKRNEEENV